MTAPPTIPFDAQDLSQKSYGWDNPLREARPRSVPDECVGHLVKDRMEGSGMRWSVPGAQSMLDLRCVYINEDWKDFHAYRIKQRVLNMYPYRDLIQQQYRATA